MQMDYFLSAASHWKHLTSKMWVNCYLELPVRLDTGNTPTCSVKLASQLLHVFVEQNSISAFVDTGSILNVCGSSFTPSVKVTSVEQEQTCWMNRYKQQGTNVNVISISLKFSASLSASEMLWSRCFCISLWQLILIPHHRTVRLVNSPHSGQCRSVCLQHLCAASAAGLTAAAAQMRELQSVWQ